MPDIVVIHYTAMRSAAAASDWLCSPASGVSAHWLIGEDGASAALVDEDMRAWHAGAGSWGPVGDVNSRSIGIELANDAASPFPAAQMDALERLLSGIVQRWDVPPERIIGHSDCAPGRKVDPGSRFDWRRLARRGLAIWPRTPSSDTADAIARLNDAAFREAMARAGYTATSDPDILLRTLRLRFRPWGRGGRDAVDDAIVTDIAERYPIDGPVDAPIDGPVDADAPRA